MEEAKEAKEKATPTPTSKSEQEHRVHTEKAKNTKKATHRRGARNAERDGMRSEHGDDEDNPDY
jgi:hypothetical protein